MGERKGRARLSAAIDRLAAAVPYGDLMAATDPAALLETAAKMLSEHPKSWEPPPDGYLDDIEMDDDLDDTEKWRAFAFAWGFERRRCSDLREDFDRRLRWLIREAAPIQGSGPDYQPAADDEVFVTVTGVVVSVAPKGAVTVDLDSGYTTDDADVRLLVWPKDVRPVDAKARSQGSEGPDDAGLVRRAIANLGRRLGRRTRWAHVHDTFAVGSSSARKLCERFGYDADEVVGRDVSHPWDYAGDPQADDEPKGPEPDDAARVAGATVALETYSDEQSHEGSEGDA